MTNAEIVDRYFMLNPRNAFLRRYSFDLVSLLDSAKLEWEVSKLQQELELTKVMLEQSQKHPVTNFLRNIRSKLPW